MLTNKHTRYDRKVTDFRLRCAARLNNRPTKSELKVISILDDLKIEYIQNYLIKRYIVDFYLPVYNVILEIDGGYHNGKRQTHKDLLRDSWLWRSGYKCHRFKNEQIEEVRTYLKSLLETAWMK